MKKDKHAAREGYKEMKREESRESGVVNPVCPPHPYNHSATDVRQGANKVSNYSGPSVSYLPPG